MNATGTMLNSFSVSSYYYDNTIAERNSYDNRLDAQMAFASSARSVMHKTVRLYGWRGDDEENAILLDESWTPR